MRCNREAPARHAVAGIPSGVARDAAARSSARIDAMIRPPPQTDNEELIKTPRAVPPSPLL